MYSNVIIGGSWNKMFSTKNTVVVHHHHHHNHPSLYFLGASLPGHTVLPLYSALDCTVGGSKEGRGSTVTLYDGYPVLLLGGAMLVHASSSSRFAFRALVVKSSCSSVVAGLPLAVGLAILRLGYVPGVCQPVVGFWADVVVFGLVVCASAAGLGRGAVGPCPCSCLL